MNFQNTKKTKGRLEETTYIEHDNITTVYENCYTNTQ